LKLTLGQGPLPRGAEKRKKKTTLEKTLRKSFFSRKKEGNGREGRNSKNLFSEFQFEKDFCLPKTDGYGKMTLNPKKDGR
jgi:hypothetical protein